MGEIQVSPITARRVAAALDYLRPEFKGRKVKEAAWPELRKRMVEGILEEADSRDLTSVVLHAGTIYAGDEQSKPEPQPPTATTAAAPALVPGEAVVNGVNKDEEARRVAAQAREDASSALAVAQSARRDASELGRRLEERQQEDAPKPKPDVRLTFEYAPGSSDRVLRAIFSNGRKIQFTYDRLGRLDGAYDI